MDKQKNGYLNKYALVLFALLCISLNSIAKDFYEQKKTTEIIVTAADSIVRINISTKNKDFKADINTSYYWYSSNKIYCNKGGYSGKLLNGDYRVFGKNGELLSSGKFNKGRKDGKWKYWNENGQLIKLEPWCKGEMNGFVYEYYPTGKPSKKTHYCHGLKNGKEQVYTLDTVLVNKYKKGKLLIPKTKNEKKKCFFFKKKQSKNTDTLHTEKKAKIKKETKLKEKRPNRKFDFHWPWKKKKQ